MSEEDSINNPHDLFARRLFSKTENMRSLISWRLPAEVLSELDLTSLQPSKESFIDMKLREGLSDLVFDVKLASGADAYVVVLFEHKSEPDPWTAFQVLRYIVSVNDQRKRNGQPLCCVIPMVLYHGAKRWTVARSMAELVESPDALARYIPQFTMPLLDLSQLSDVELREESLFLAYMSLLKYIKRDELPERLPELFVLFRKLFPPATALESFETILRYITSGTDRVSRAELRSAVTQALKTEGESIMPTIAEEWKKEGLEKGRQEGTLIGRILALEEFLGQAASAEESLQRLSLSELERMSESLNAAIRGRG
jgi:predicted transposase/invertase (TIGR01784 family)